MNTRKLCYLILFLVSFSSIMMCLIPLSHKDKDSTIVQVDRMNNVQSSATLELLRDFEPSTYYISPEITPGSSDGAFFSFMTNKDANYSITVENHPSFITNTEAEENTIAFDNPYGTDDWYISFNEIDQYEIGRVNYKLLKSSDKGKSWSQKVIHSAYANVTDPFDLFFYIQGNAMSIDPNSGLMIISTWFNASSFAILRSIDHGETWSDPIEIYSGDDLGCQGLLDSYGITPGMDIAILRDGTIVSVTQADDPSFTEYIYFESYDNGTTWTQPANITAVEGLERVVNLQIAVDHDTGRYFTMWEGDNGVNNTNQWCRYFASQTLGDFVQYKNMTGYKMYGNFDFIVDHKNSLLRVLEIYYTGITQFANWSCTGFASNMWSRTENPNYQELPTLYTDSSHIGYVFDEENHLFYVDDVLGNDDIYHLKSYDNLTFWEYKANCSAEELVQVYWNGRKTDSSFIETSLVKVIFNCQNVSSLSKETYITIDNSFPGFTDFQQLRYYFNPLFSNISLTTIPWELRSTESCDATIEIFSENKSTSSWSQINNNNWDDTNPVIFLSNTDVIYILYETLESGRKIIYLIKSVDMGVTWSAPNKIFESSGDRINYQGAAWEDNLYLIIEPSYSERYLLRSFDQGETITDEIDLDAIVSFDSQAAFTSDFIAEENGSLFLAYHTYSDGRFYVLRSDDLGLTWSQSKMWDLSEDSPNYVPQLAYDSLRDTLYWLIPIEETFPDFTREINMTISTLNLTTDTWSNLKVADVVNTSIFESQPQIYILRDNVTADSEVHIDYLYNVQLPEVISYHRELVSTDGGTTWDGPFTSSYDLYDDLASILDEKFYVVLQSDGNDAELFFKREGRLVKSISASVNPNLINDIEFDGINDFGDYIDSGNYSYQVRLQDYAGNEALTEGWFYADYDSPSITQINLNKTHPVPSLDVNISATIQDEIGYFSTLFYRYDSQSWKNTTMISGENDNFYAIIPGQTNINKISYYIESYDLAGNIIETPEYNYEDNNAPLIKDLTLNETIPLPTVDVNITVNITDDSAFNSRLYYRRDGQVWQHLNLLSVGKDFYSAVIHGGINTKRIDYYIWSNDSSGNIIQTSEYSYFDNNAPQITDLTTNMTRDPTPLDNVLISVNITDISSFSPVLFYSLDDQDFISTPMIWDHGDLYHGIIPKSVETKEIRYYINVTDASGNLLKYDNAGLYYSYDLPDFVWSSDNLLKEDESYSSGESYEISIEINNDLQFIEKVLFRYSFDEGETWNDLELKQNSPEFKGVLRDIPGDLRTLHYKIIIVNIYGTEEEILDEQKVNFYPEVPSAEFDQFSLTLVITISAIIGFTVAFGYIRLKSISHQAIYKQIYLTEFMKTQKRSDTTNETTSISKKKNYDEEENELQEVQEFKIATPFTRTYVFIAFAMISLFSLAYVIAQVNPQTGILFIGASLLLSVFGYMILFSRDITVNIYLEKIKRGNIALETFQIIFMGLNIVSILIIGYSIDWFRYYLIESTFEFGDFSIPRLYLSVIGVFFTSLVLVAITTYVQLVKTVRSMRNQRKQGASDNLLLYLKDENSSKMITRLGYKTIVFLVTVLIGIITTTNLLTPEMGFILLVVLVPFVLAGFFALLFHRIISLSSKTSLGDLNLPFIDSQKECKQCGEKIFLAEKFCGECGAQQIFTDMVGTYVARCPECSGLLNDRAKFCPTCGISIETDSKNHIKN